MRKISSPSGFTLVEVLVSLAILAGTFFIGIELFRQSQEKIRNQEIDLAFEILGKTIRQKVHYPNTCNTFFSFTSPFSVTAASTATGIPIRVVIDSDNNIAAVTGASNLEGLNIQNFRLTDLAPSDLSGVPRKYTGLIKLQAEKTQNLLGGKALKERVLGAMTIETDASGNFTGCYTDNSPTFSCAAMGGTYDPLKTPACQFSMSLGTCTNVNEYLVGFDNGVPICKSLDGACPAGAYLLGVSSTGVICSP